MDSMRRPLVAAPDPVSPVSGSTLDETARGWDDWGRAQVAALYVENAIHGRTALQVPDPSKLRLYYMFHGSVYRSLYLLVVCAHLSLVLIEPPAIGGLTFLCPSKGVLAAAELAFTALYAVDWWLESRIVNNAAFFRKSWPRAKLACILVLAAGVLTGLAWTPYQAHVARVVRPFFLMEKLRNVRKIFSSIAASTQKIGKVALIIAFHVGFFGSAAFLLFGGGAAHTHRPMTPQPNFTRCDAQVQISPFQDSTCGDYFGRLDDGLLQLFVLLTTANYPDIALPYIRHTVWSFLFFFVFTAVGIFFLMNLVLAEIYNGYMDASRSKTTKKLQGRRTLLRAAYRLLAGADPRDVTEVARSGEPKLVEEAEQQPPRTPSGGVSRRAWLRLMAVLRPGMRRSDAKVLFDAIDVHRNGALGEVEFRALCSLATIRFVRRPHRPAARGLLAPFVFVSRRLVATPWTGRFFDLFVLSSAAVLFVRSSSATNGLSASWTIASHVITFVFLAEIAIKLLGVGADAFWRAWWNRLDALAVTVSVASFLVDPTFGRSEAHPGAGTREGVALGMLKVAVLLRAIRCVRALRLLKRYDLVLNTVASLLPTLWRFMAILFVLFYAWGVVGMDLLSGKLVRGDPVIARSSYGQLNYYVLNFDQMGPAMVTLFYVLIGNNWPVIMEGAVAAYRGTAIRLYFISFFILSGVIVTNVLVAFILDTFSIVYEDKSRLAAGEAPRWDVLIRHALEQRHQRLRRVRGGSFHSEGVSTASDRWTLEASSVQGSPSSATDDDAHLGRGPVGAVAEPDDSEANLSGATTEEEDEEDWWGAEGDDGVQGTAAAPTRNPLLTASYPGEAGRTRLVARARPPCLRPPRSKAGKSALPFRCFPASVVRRLRWCARAALAPCFPAAEGRERRAVELQKRKTFNDYFVLKFMADLPTDVGISLDRLRTVSGVDRSGSGRGATKSLRSMLAADAREDEAASDGYSHTDSSSKAPESLRGDQTIFLDSLGHVCGAPSRAGSAGASGSGDGRNFFGFDGESEDDGDESDWDAPVTPVDVGMSGIEPGPFRE